MQTEKNYKITLWNGLREETLFRSGTEKHVVIDYARWKFKKMYGGNWIVIDCEVLL